MSLSFHTTQLMYVCMDAGTSVPGAQRVKQGAENSEGSFLVLKQQLIWINLRGGRPENMNPPLFYQEQEICQWMGKIYTSTKTQQSKCHSVEDTITSTTHTSALPYLAAPFPGYFPAGCHPHLWSMCTAAWGPSVLNTGCWPGA